MRYVYQTLFIASHTSTNWNPNWHSLGSVKTYIFSKETMTTLESMSHTCRSCLWQQLSSSFQYEKVCNRMELFYLWTANRIPALSLYYISFLFFIMSIGKYNPSVMHPLPLLIHRKATHSSPGNLPLVPVRISVHHRPTLLYRNE